MEKYILEFISKLGEPTSRKSLIQYLEFVITSSIITESSIYKENHHILPSSIFDCADVYSLNYADHVKAHILLAEAYPIRSFLRPLNFMLDRSEKEHIGFKEKLSTSVKIWWRNFKETDQYNEWRKKRSILCSSHMLNGHAKYMNSLANTPENNQKRRESAKKIRGDKEKEKIRIEKLKATINTPEGKEKTKKAAKKKWDARDLTERDDFKKKMTVINQNEDKRKNAGIKIKEKWKDPIYREKMSKRNKGSNSITMKEKWKDPEFRKMMIEKRKQKEK